jgi:excisionase family DNA binding protein
MPRRHSPIKSPPLSDIARPMHQTVPADSSPFSPVEPDKSERTGASILLIVAEVATRLRVSEKTVRRRIKEGVIRTVPLGGRLTRVSPDELQRVTAGEPLPAPSKTSI